MVGKAFAWKAVTNLALTAELGRSFQRGKGITNDPAMKRKYQTPIRLFRQVSWHYQPWLICNEVSDDCRSELFDRRKHFFHVLSDETLSAADSRHQCALLHNCEEQ